jgi:fructuronate reductase
VARSGSHYWSVPAPLPRLNRAAGDGRPIAPIRIVHLGLGQFFRAHVAWYTDAAPDADEWGIAAFTGRSSERADVLVPQEGLYTLIVRHPGGDEATVISSISAALPGADVEAFVAAVARPEVAIITLTVTEAGYAMVSADTSPSEVALTVPGRLVAGLGARRAAGSGPLAIVPCDNLPDNGGRIEAAIRDLAGRIDPTLVGWIEANVSFVTTMVDRITPSEGPDDAAAAAALTGRVDAAPVVTEPFSEWVLSGDFPAGRPQWEAAGAQFVDDVAPFEQRKLWLLNGGHSLMAYLGSARGHITVDQAAADPVVLRMVEAWWDEAARHLTIPAADILAARAALVDRWANPHIRHRLAQIAMDGSQKLPVRVSTVMRAERAAGRLPVGGVAIVAAWINHLRGVGAPVADVDAANVVALASGAVPGPDGAAARIVAYLTPELGGDRELIDAVARRTEPKVFVVMGVSGSGKSTVAAALADELGCDLADGDDLHPPANVAKQAAGQPLTDEDRWPWLDRIAEWLTARVAAGQSGVVACSALKRVYRDRLRGERVVFVHLRGDHATVAARLDARTDHFMPATLLDSQFATLEPPTPDEQVIDVDITLHTTTAAQVAAVVAAA